MNCERAQIELSARMDGEPPGRLASAVDEHVAGCPSCRAFEAGAARVRTAVRIRSAEPVPDLIATIMTRVAAEPRTPSRLLRAPAPSVRIGLAGSHRSWRRRSPGSWPVAWSSADRGRAQPRVRSPRRPSSWTSNRPLPRSMRSRGRSPSPSEDSRRACHCDTCAWTSRSERRNGSGWMSGTLRPTRRGRGHRRTSRTSPTVRRRTGPVRPVARRCSPRADVRRRVPRSRGRRRTRRRHPHPRTWCCR